MHIKDCCGEILCTAKPASGVFGLMLFGNGETEKAPWLNIQYDTAQPNQIRLDEKAIPLQPGKLDELELHLYIDGSVVEAFINKRAAFTKRFYDQGSSAPQLNITVSGKPTRLSSLSMWQLTPISTNRLTT
jgi:beta-fructofuranosidase